MLAETLLPLLPVRLPVAGSQLQPLWRIMVQDHWRVTDRALDCLVE